MVNTNGLHFIDTDPKLTEKKLPLVLRERTAWAMAPLPTSTRISVPGERETKARPGTETFAKFIPEQL